MQLYIKASLVDSCPELSSVQKPTIVSMRVQSVWRDRVVVNGTKLPKPYQCLINIVPLLPTTPTPTPTPSLRFWRIEDNPTYVTILVFIWLRVFEEIQHTILLGHIASPRNRTLIEEEHHLLTDCKGKRHSAKPIRHPRLSSFCCMKKLFNQLVFWRCFLLPGASEPKTKYIFELS